MDAFDSHRIIVTGASGLLGCNLLLDARERGARLLGVYREHPIQPPGIEMVRADLRDRRAVHDLVAAFQPDWIIHCAALTDVDYCEQHPEVATEVHVEATRHLVTAAGAVGARFIHISTDSVFDGATGNYSEDDPPRPLNVYARTKLAGEEVVRSVLPRSLILRTNIYGWNRQAKSSLAEWMLHRLESDQPVPAFADVVFSPILVNDLADVVRAMMSGPVEGLFHVAGAESCSKYQFALHLSQVFGLSNGLVQRSSLQQAALKAPRPLNTSLQTAKASKALARPMPGIVDGLQRFKALRDYRCAANVKL